MTSAAGTENIARRYAKAFFELASEQNQIAQIEQDMDTLAQLATQGGDFARFIQNTTVPRAQQSNAIVAIAKHLKVSALSEKFVGTLAQNQRLPVLAQVVAAVQKLIAAHKGEATAEVTSAIELSDAQIKQLADHLKKIMGLTVKINVTVDPAIVGGLVVRVGSKLMDASVKTKLERLHRALKNPNDISDSKKMKEVA